MLLPKFNSQALKDQLTKIECKRQLAFGAACCERLVPNYSAFQKDTGWGSIQPIREALNIVWSSLCGYCPNSKDIKQLLASCEAVAPNSDDFKSSYVSFAQDADFAVCGLLDYLLESNIEKISQAAIYATDSVDLYVQEIENMDPNDVKFEHNILTHRFMQRELQRQKDDLDFLRQVPELNTAVVELFQDSCSNGGGEVI